MQTAGERDAILLVRGADRRRIVRHCDDRPRRWGRNLDRNGGIGVSDADLWFGLGLRRRGVGHSLLLQPIEPLLQQPELFLQSGNLFSFGACRLRAGLRNGKCRHQSDCNLGTLHYDSHGGALLVVGVRMVREETILGARVNAAIDSSAFSNPLRGASGTTVRSRETRGPAHATVRSRSLSQLGHSWAEPRRHFGLSQAVPLL